MSFADRISGYRERIERVLDQHLPRAAIPPTRLHEAMRYSVLGGGKRLRPLLVYASGEAFGVDVAILDNIAAAVEFMHAFSLIHDDLPAMDDDDLRRGRPTTHRAFDEATAILAADALQPLAFAILAADPHLVRQRDAQINMIRLLAEACGTNGMTGGQAMDMEAEKRQLDQAELEHLYRLKTGRLLRASVLMPTCCPPVPDTPQLHALEQYVDYIGLAFQIRDDMLDIEGATEAIGKPQGSDLARDKATMPALLGIEGARQRADELLAGALAALQQIPGGTDGLTHLARYIVLRNA